MGRGLRLYGIDGGMTEYNFPEGAKIDFYFDFLSPFSYLANHRLVDVAARFGLDIDYKPIDLARAKLAIGNNGPTNRDLPIKLAYLAKDLERWAKRVGIPLAFPPDYHTGLINKGTFYAMGRGREADYVRAGFAMVWGGGKSPQDEQNLRELSGKMGWPGDDFMQYVASDKAADAYNASTEQAIDNHVFGVPSMCFAGQMWWGNDRVDFLEEFLHTYSKS